MAASHSVCVDSGRGHTAATVASPTRTTVRRTHTARAPLRQDGARAQDDTHAPGKVWVGPGIAVLVQCICLFVGGLIFRIVRRKEEHAI